MKKFFEDIDAFGASFLFVTVGGLTMLAKEYIERAYPSTEYVMGLRIEWHDYCVRPEQKDYVKEPCSSQLVVFDVVSGKRYPIGFTEKRELLFAIDYNEAQPPKNGDYVLAMGGKDEY